jgi:hypothetical protein
MFLNSLSFDVSTGIMVSLMPLFKEREEFLRWRQTKTILWRRTEQQWWCKKEVEFSINFLRIFTSII